MVVGRVGSKEKDCWILEAKLPREGVRGRELGKRGVTERRPPGRGAPIPLKPFNF